jgi:hypothetical protein
LPYVIRPKRLPVKLAAVAATGLATLVLAPVAAAACPAQATTQAFKALGDSAAYSLVSSGAFESGTTGWTLSGASVGSGNEPWKVRSSADAKSLTITPTGRVVSPSFCVGVEHPSFRFFARRTTGTWGVLNVRLRWKEAGGATNETTVGSLSAADTKWQASPKLALATVLPLWASGMTASAQIVLEPEDFGGGWAVDDVYIDPYTRG